MENYCRSQHLVSFQRIADGSLALGKRLFAHYAEVFMDGALLAREKSLIALAVAHALQCPYCIDAYTEDCLQKRADFAQMTETLHVARNTRRRLPSHGMRMRDKAKKLGM